MSTIKITDLPQISTLNPNTDETVFVGVDLSANITAQFSAQTIGSSLYSNNPLAVGNNLIVFSNTTAQFSATDPTFTQINLQNFSNTGAADYIITADTGTNSNSYVDLGINNSQWNPALYGQTSQQPYDGYLIVQGPTTNGNQGNLVIGTASANANLIFAVGGQFANNISAKMTANGLVLNTQSYLTFSDGTVQRSAAATNAYSVAAFAAANTAAANTVLLTGVNLTQNTSIAAAFVQANSAFGVANNALANTTGTLNGSLTITGNVTANYAFVQSAVNFTSNGTIATSTGINNSKNLSITAGNDSGGYPGGSITITSGTSNSTGGTGGNINLNPGTGNVTNGSVNVNGKMIVTGNVTASYLVGNVIGSTIQNTINWLTTSVQPTQQTGQLFFYANTTSLVLDTDIPNNRISVSKTIYFRAFNSTGATIPANSWVRLIAGVTPNTVPYIALADATTSANSTVAGFVSSAIANSAYGIVYQSGLVEEFNSTGLGSTGDILFLSATPGQASNVAPTGSNTVVQVARILNSDPVLGKIQIVTQLRQAYGRPNGSVLYAYANNITSSNTISINDSTQTLTGNNIVANTITISGNTAATSYVNTWTPNVAFSTANGTMTYTAQYGNYVKVGRQVTAYFTLNVTNSGGSGNMFINGLPFAAATGSGSVGLTTTGGVLTGPSAGNLGTISGNVTSGATSTALYTINNTGNGSLTQYPVAAGTGNGGIGSPFTINGMISYISAN
jgi:hypothetical protein